MEIQEAGSLQDLNLVDRFLFDETMEVSGKYQITVNILSENKVAILDRAQTEKELLPIRWQSPLPVKKSKQCTKKFRK